MIITDDVEKRFYEKVRLDWQWIGGKSYGYGVMRVGNRSELAHRISYQLHNGEIPPGMCVLHSCDDPGCVFPKHLHLGTPLENAKERSERGRSGDICGEKNGRSKLTPQQVLEIKEKYKDGQLQCDLALEFGVNQPRISSIVTKRSWKHL